MQSLPIHLAGCKRLLVLFGKTYPQRLWTLMEIFVFVHGGGSISRMRVEPLALAGDMAAQGNEDTSTRLKSIGRIDVAAAGCRDVEVRQRLLAIIESAFGDTRSFNHHVESLLTTASSKGFTRTLTRSFKRAKHSSSTHGPLVV